MPAWRQLAPHVRHRQHIGAPTERGLPQQASTVFPVERGGPRNWGDERIARAAAHPGHFTTSLGQAIIALGALRGRRLVCYRTATKPSRTTLIYAVRRQSQV